MDIFIICRFSTQRTLHFFLPLRQSLYNKDNIVQEINSSRASELELTHTFMFIYLLSVPSNTVSFP